MHHRIAKVAGVVVATIALLVRVGGAQAEADPSATGPSAPTPEHTCLFSSSPQPDFVQELLEQTETVVDTDDVCPVPQAAIWASPNPASYGGNTTIGWSSQYAWDCSWSGGGYSGSGTDGSLRTGALYNSFSVGITCTGTC